MEMSEIEPAAIKRQVWNAGRTVGAKRALKPKQIWEIRFCLDQHRRLRDRALFDLAIDSKVRGCDLVRMKICDVVGGGAGLRIGTWPPFPRDRSNDRSCQKQTIGVCLTAISE